MEVTIKKEEPEDETKLTVQDLFPQQSSASCEIYYLDENGNLTTQENAVKGITRELDKEGNLVRETFFKIDRRTK